MPFFRTRKWRSLLLASTLVPLFAVVFSLAAPKDISAYELISIHPNNSSTCTTAGGKWISDKCVKLPLSKDDPNISYEDITNILNPKTSTVCRAGGGTWEQAWNMCIKGAIKLTGPESKPAETPDATTSAPEVTKYTTPEACDEAGYKWDDAVNKCTDPDASSTCQIEGIGWIVCPVMNAMAAISDVGFSFLSSFFLETKTEYTSSRQVEEAWGMMRSFANVVFIIVFLLIIFSQLTSTGIGNYGVKKMLPRLIIAAILVNLSLIICQIAVDGSNILGHGLKKLFDLIGQVAISYDPMDPSASTAVTAGSWGVAITALLAGGITIAFAFSVPVLLATLLSLLMTVLILVGRTALIIVLVVVSPLAFVAYLLPNTEQWFKKWYKMFAALLMVFPIISVVFGGSSLVANIINSAATDPDKINGPHEWIMQVIALGVMAVPLFVVPSLLKNAMSAAGSIGTKMAGWSSKANGRVGARVKDSSELGRRMQEFQSAQTRRRAAGAIRRRNKTGASGFGQKLDNSRLGKFLGSDRGSLLSEDAEYKLFKEEVDLEKNKMHGDSQESWLATMNDSNASEERRSAAAGLLAEKGSRQFQVAALESARQLARDSDPAAKNIQKQMYSDMKTRPYALGNQAADALRTGNYGAAGDDGVDHNTPLQTSFDSRLATKLSERKLLGLDPDEINEAVSMAEGGTMSQSAMESMVKNIHAAQNNDLLKGDITKEQSAAYERILTAAAAHGITPPTTTASGSGGTGNVNTPPQNTGQGAAHIVPASGVSSTSSQPNQRSFNPRKERDPSNASTFAGGEEVRDSGLIIPRGSDK